MLCHAAGTVVDLILASMSGLTLFIKLMNGPGTVGGVISTGTTVPNLQDLVRLFRVPFVDVVEDRDDFDDCGAMGIHDSTFGGYCIACVDVVDGGTG